MNKPNFECMTFRELKEFITYNDLSNTTRLEIKNIVSKFEVINFLDFLLKVEKIDDFYTKEEVREILICYKNENLKKVFTAPLIINLIKYDETLISFFSNRYAINNLFEVFSDKMQFEFICNKLVDFHGIYGVLEWLNSPISHEKREKITPILFKRLAKEYNGFNPEQIKFLNNLYTGFNSKVDWDGFISFLKTINTSYDMAWLLSFYDRSPEVCKYIKDNIPDTKNKILMSKVKETFKHSFALMIEIINVDLLNDELKKIYLDAQEILKHRNKVNALYSNTRFNYDLVTKIYPALGMDITLSLLKYHTKAYHSILTMLENNSLHRIIKYIEFYEKNEIFPKNDEMVHEAFQNVGKYWNLLREIVDNDVLLSDADIYYFREILLNENVLEINTVEELKNYNEKLANYVFNLSEMCIYPVFLGCVRRFDPYNLLEQYNIDNISVIKFLYDSILKNKTLDNKEILTKEDVELIKYISVLLSEDLEEIKLYCKKRYEEGKSISIAYEFRKLIKKIKRLYEKEYNSKFSELSSFDDCATKTYKGVKVINVKDKNFNFLLHHLYGYDPEFNDYPAMIENDPSLWTKLEGATTLSLSSISEKNTMHVIGRNDNVKRIKFLFNYIPEDSLICASTLDAGVEHGGHVLKPMYCNETFYDLDTLNNLTRERKSYNEVACYREGMIPCAIAIFDPFPTNEEINAAKYFNIPILYINKGLCNKNIEIYRKLALEQMETKVTKDNLKALINNSNESLKAKISKILKLIQEQKNREILTIDEFNELMKYLYKTSLIMHIDKKVIDKIKWMWKINLLANKENTQYKLQSSEKEELCELETQEENYILLNVKTNYFDLGIERIEAENLIAITNLKRKLNINSIDQCDYLDLSKSVLKLIDYKSYGSKNEKVCFSLNGLEIIIKESVLAWFFNGNKNLKSSKLVYKENGELVINSNIKITSILDRILEQGKYNKKNIYGSVFDKLVNGELNEQEVLVITDILDCLDAISDEEFINIFIGYLNLPEIASEKNILIEKLLLRKHTFSDEIRQFIGFSRKLEK